MFTKLKNWVLAKAKATLLVQVQDLDKYEAVLADQIRIRLDPDTKAKQVVELTQKELKALISKVFSYKFLHTWVFGSVEDQLLAEIDKLSNYEDDLAELLRRHLDADAKAKLVVDYVQDLLTSLIDKYIP
jgi:hypothetical protein